MAPRTAYRQPQGGGQGFARTKKVFGNSVTLIAADVALNAQTAVLRVPKGFVLQALGGTIGNLDTGATLMLALGDAGLNNRFMAASNIGQAGGIVGAVGAVIVPAAVLYEFTEDTDILLTATVAAVGLEPNASCNILMEGYMK